MKKFIFSNFIFSLFFLSAFAQTSTYQEDLTKLSGYVPTLKKSIEALDKHYQEIATTKDDELLVMMLRDFITQTETIKASSKSLSDFCELIKPKIAATNCNEAMYSIDQILSSFILIQNQGQKYILETDKIILNLPASKPSIANLELLIKDFNDSIENIQSTLPGIIKEIDDCQE